MPSFRARKPTQVAAFAVRAQPRAVHSSASQDRSSFAVSFRKRNAPLVGSNDGRMLEGLPATASPCAIRGSPLAALASSAASGQS